MHDYLKKLEGEIKAHAAKDSRMPELTGKSVDDMHKMLKTYKMAAEMARGDWDMDADYDAKPAGKPMAPAGPTR